MVFPVFVNGTWYQLPMSAIPDARPFHTGVELQAALRAVPDLSMDAQYRPQRGEFLRQNGPEALLLHAMT